MWVWKPFTQASESTSWFMTISTSLGDVHIPPQFVMKDDQTLSFIRSVGAGHVVTSVDGNFESTLLPFTLTTDGSAITVRAHISKANPQHRTMDGAECLLIVSGPDAYVSPANYPSKADGGKVVPTWNYAIAHIRGTITTFDDHDTLLHDVSGLSDHHEVGQAHPWSVDDAPKDYIDDLLKGIVGIEIAVSSIVGKAKLSQNRPETDRTTVRDAFLQGTHRERQVGELMND